MSKKVNPPLPTFLKKSIFTYIKIGLSTYPVAGLKMEARDIRYGARQSFDPQNELTGNLWRKSMVPGISYRLFLNTLKVVIAFFDDAGNYLRCTTVLLRPNALHAEPMTSKTEKEYWRHD